MADINELKGVRRGKVATLRKLGLSPYPEKTPKKEEIASILEQFSSLKSKKKRVCVAGRIVGLRGHGGALFMDIRDEGGTLQVLASKSVVGKKAFELAQLLDLGDFVAIAGTLFVTKREQKSLEAKKITLLTKSVRPLPDSWFGLKDADERFRDREVDFLLNPKSAEQIRTRGKVLKSLRQIMEDADFLEVQTPILQSIAGGATAKPFKTKLNALNMQLNLRIAPELFLKRLVVGGFERVYELGPSFRNEGMDATHNPEFTTLEFYWAYQDFEGLLSFTEKLLKRVVKDSLGKTELSYQGKIYNFAKPLPRIEYAKALEKYSGVDPLSATDKELHAAAKKHSVSVDGVVRGQIIDHLFKKVVAPNLPEPCFVIHHPTEISALAKASDEDPRIAKRLQVYVGGFEALNAYAELNDPAEQEERFKHEAKKRAGGDDEAQRKDEDFIRALEYGLPPTAGFGMGVDRFVMLLTDTASIREVIAFPTMRPKKRN